MEKKNTATSSKIIKAVCTSYDYVYVFCTSKSGQLEYNSLFVGVGGWGIRGNERNIFRQGGGWERGWARCWESCGGGKYLTSPFGWHSDVCLRFQSHANHSFASVFTRQLTFTCTWGRRYFTDYKHSPKSELCVIENSYTRLLSACSKCLNRWSILCRCLSDSNSASSDVLCFAILSNVQSNVSAGTVDSHSVCNYNQLLLPKRGPLQTDVWHQKPDNCSGNTVPLHSTELPLLAA
jgi:hypothetical protein